MEEKKIMSMSLINTYLVTFSDEVENLQSIYAEFPQYFVFQKY